jgi:hypothetical protein
MLHYVPNTPSNFAGIFTIKANYLEEGGRRDEGGGRRDEG